MTQIPNLNDPSFSERFSMGDKNVFTTVVQTLSPYLKGFLLKITRNEDIAEEIAQEAFVRAYSSSHTYRPELSSIKTWITRIALNALKDYHKREKKERLKVEEATFNAKRKGFKRDELSEKTRESVKLLRKAVAELDEGKKLTFILIFEMNLSDEEIANELSISREAVRKRRERFRKMIRQILQI